MREQQIDIEMVLDADEKQINDPDFGRALMERMRDAAAAQVQVVGGRLRTDRETTFYHRRAMAPGTSFQQARDVLLVASRWWAEVPDDFVPTGP